MMSPQPGAAYLETQVMTAPPQKLKLMLIDAALRFARKTIDDWSAQQEEAAFDSLRRARAIVAELLAGVDRSAADKELARQVTGMYVFLFRTLSEAQAERSEKKVRDVIGVLEIERETWQAVCEQHDRETAPRTAAAAEVVLSKSTAALSATPADLCGVASHRQSKSGLDLQG